MQNCWYWFSTAGGYYAQFNQVQWIFCLLYIFLFILLFLFLLSCFQRDCKICRWSACWNLFFRNLPYMGYGEIKSAILTGTLCWIKNHVLYLFCKWLMCMCMDAQFFKDFYGLSLMLKFCFHTILYVAGGEAQLVYLWTRKV